MNGTLLYIPFIYSSDGCIEVGFSDGILSSGSYINPNQTYAFLLNGSQDYSSCVGTSSICVGCEDNNLNFICDDEDIYGCTDELACNYDSFTFDDGSCAFTDGICDTGKMVL